MEQFGYPDSAENENLADIVRSVKLNQDDQIGTHGAKLSHASLAAQAVQLYENELDIETDPIVDPDQLHPNPRFMYYTHSIVVPLPERQIGFLCKTSPVIPRWPGFSV